MLSFLIVDTLAVLPVILGLAMKYVAPAVASALVGGALNKLGGSKGVTQPGQVPTMEGMDIDALLAKPKQATDQSQLSRLTLN